MKIIAAFVVALVAGPWQAAAQTPASPTRGFDARWMPWFGCWQLEGTFEGARVCVVPAEGASVQVLTLEDDRLVGEETVAADGRTHAIDDPSCAGTETADWSQTARSVFRRAELVCGDGATRSVAGVWFATREHAWTEVQSVDAAGARSVRVRRYVRTADERLPEGLTVPRISPRATSTTPVTDATWNVDEVIEASARLPLEVVQAVLVELGGGFALDARTLVAMHEAGVDEGVIDLMVALSYPKRFEVKPASAASLGEFGGWPDVEDVVRRHVWPGGLGYSPFGFASPYWASCLGWYGCGMYSPYYSSYYDPYYYYGGGGWVIVTPGPGAPDQPVREGRVVKGLGYTQVSVRQDPPASTPATASGSGDQVTSSGSTGQASPQGYSGGASGGASGASGTSGASAPRTAQPRPPGE